VSFPSPCARRLFTACAVGVMGIVGRAAVAAPCCGLAWQFQADAAPPFSLTELEQAVRIRQPDGAAGDQTVAVQWARPGVIEARSRDRRRAIELGGLRGPEAARVVAVAVLDVRRPAGFADAASAADGARDADGTTLSARAAPPSTRPPGARLRLGLGAALNHGATSAGLALEPTGSAALALAGLGQRGQLGLAFEAGYGQGRGRVGGQNFVVHMIPLRLCAFVAQGGYTLAAGALVRPYLTSGWGGGSGVLAGGTATAEARWPSAPERPLAATLGAGVDVAANAVDFRVGNVSLLNTGRVVPWMRLGISWRAL
jgi:hypothetical protein